MNRFIGYRFKVLFVIEQQVNFCALTSNSRYFVVQLNYLTNLEIVFLQLPFQKVCIIKFVLIFLKTKHIQGFKFFVTSPYFGPLKSE